MAREAGASVGGSAAAEAPQEAGRPEAQREEEEAVMGWRLHLGRATSSAERVATSVRPPPSCPKCGCGPWTGPRYQSAPALVPYEADWLTWTCDRCGYVHMEAPLDRAKKEHDHGD